MPWKLLRLVFLGGLALTAVPNASDQDRPAWVESRPERVNSEYRIPIRVGPYATILECESQLRPAVETAIDEYVELLIGPQARGQVRVPWSYVEERLIRERYVESRPFQLTSTQQSEMTTLHVLLSFDRAANEFLRQLWQQSLGNTRAFRLGLSLGGLVWVMTVCWGYLRLDLWTRGRYRGKLRFAALILSLVPFATAGFFFLA